MSSPVLYVEDEVDYQMLVQRILGKSGLKVHISSTGSEGFSALERLKPQLVILDINLPDTDGYSICSKLRQDPTWKAVPIMMLTVRRRPEEWLKGFSCGADDYVSKPLNPPELVERVRACMECRHPHSEEAAGAEYQLVQAVVSGNRMAFEVLIQKYKERLIDSLCASGRNYTDAEDLASSAFIRAYEKLTHFRGHASFYTWLYRIAINEAHRQRRKVTSLSLEEMTGGDESILPKAFAEPDPNGQKMNAHVQQAQLRQVVACVPKPYRQMLRWHCVRGWSYDAMARRLGIPAGTVMSRLFKAKQLLRQSWARQAG